MQRPNFAASVFASATETLALWLAQGWPPVAAAVGEWSEAHWSAAEWVAFWQGAIPGWAQRLDDAPAVLIAPERRARLQDVVAQSHARTERMLGEVQDMIRGLSAQGVELAPLKGARVAPFYYQPASLRPLGDVDVLIRPADVTKARRWMDGHGYTFYSRSEEDVVYLRGTRRPEVWHPDNVHPVELHFRLREEFGGAGLHWDMSPSAWRESALAPYLQTETRLVSPPFLLRHLCAHMASDLFIRRGKIQQMEDIARVARGFAPGDWDAFRSGVPARCARFVYPALALTGRTYGDVAPLELMREMRAQVSPQLRAWVDASTLASASESNPESRSGIGVELARLLAETRWETARALTASLLPPRWNLMKRYPRLAASPLYPLCYVLLNLDRVWHVSQKLARGRSRAL
ncbi:MAG: nucleotidyltransferase family protein [Chloroflexi bacterium]|nr:nucleotidyltransferase family protein [Chloroflexota bacterium]